jgi:hypothetical protein
MNLVTPAGTTLHPREEPCPECPFRKDSLGKNPKEVFEVGRNQGVNSFGCHTAKTDEGGDSTLICAGWLASQDSNKNPAILMARRAGGLPWPSKIRCEAEMYGTYDEMAKAHLEHD